MPSLLQVHSLLCLVLAVGAAGSGRRLLQSPPPQPEEGDQCDPRRDGWSYSETCFGEGHCSLCAVSYLPEQKPSYLRFRPICLLRPKPAITSAANLWRSLTARARLRAQRPPRSRPAGRG